MTTPTPLPSHAEPFPTLADALVELGLLRERLERLEQEVATMRGASPRPAVRDPLSEQDVAHSQTGGAVASTPLAAVLAGDEETASQHLAHLRSAISRLRDERAHASAEFRSLTQPVRAEAPDADLGLERAEIAAAADNDMVMVDSTTLEVVTSANEGPDEPWGFPASARAVPPPAASGPQEAPSSQPAPPASAGAATPDHGRDTVAELREKLQQKERSAARAAGDLPVQNATPVRSRRRWPWIAATLVLLAAAAAWWLGPILLPRLGVHADPDETASLTTAPPASAPAASASLPAGGAAGEAARTAAPAPLVVALATSREVWLRVLVDGVRSLERTVPGGETLRFEARGTLQLVAGDAGAVRLEINGQAQGPLGPDGQVARRRIDAPTPGPASGQPQ